MLEVIFQNDNYVAINKPHGLLVHKTKMAKDAREFALQMIRDQINCSVYPIHRLDRKTSGVLVFAKNSAANQLGQRLFREQKVDKTYVALVRGFIEKPGRIDYSLKHNQKLQEAITDYKPLKYFEIPLAHNGHDSSRYTLVELRPYHGRFHQLRKHMAHIFHPIIGDRPHGCNKQNRLWKDQFNMTTMLLHAESIQIPFDESHPSFIKANKSVTFESVLMYLNSFIREGVSN